MKQINHKELASLIRHYYNTKWNDKKFPLFVWGHFGIGKSVVVLEQARNIAKERDRKFVEWNRLTEQEKENVFENCEKYFVLIDVRLSEFDASDIKGLPIFKDDKKSIEFKVPYWALLLEKDESDGILFFDEINLACFKKDTEILTENGLKMIDKIKEGDKVLDKNGKYSPVLATQKTHYKGDIYKIKATGLQELEATPNHPFLVIERYRKSNKKWNIKLTISKPKWKRTDELRKGNYVGVPIIKELTKKKDINQNIAELLGYYTAEGSYNKGSQNSYRVNLVFGKDEESIAKRVKEIVGLEFNRNAHIKKRNNSWVVRFSIDKKIKKLFDSCGKGARNKKIPNFILRNEEISILKSYLYGYWKGDGCFVKKSNTSFISFTTISKKLALGLQLAFVRFGVLTTINKDKKIREHKIGNRIIKSGGGYIIRTPNKRIHNFFDLDFKRKRATEHFFIYNDKIWTKIKNISKKEEFTEIYNFEVKDSNTYIANNILTHNTPIVISSCYKIIYDRIINNSKINKNWLIIGCGNLSEDRAYTHDIAPPLRDRGGEVVLACATIDNWTEWAIKNEIDSRIIGFLNFKTSNLYKVDFDDEQKYTTYRGWQRVSNLIKGIKDYKVLELISSSAIGEGISKEFVAFCKINEKINLEGFIKEPRKLKTIKDVGIKYFVITAIADRYKDKKINFAKIYDISKILDDGNAEFVALLWRLCSGYSKRFRQEFLGKVDEKFAVKYANYMLE